MDLGPVRITCSTERGQLVLPKAVTRRKSPWVAQDRSTVSGSLFAATDVSNVGGAMPGAGKPCPEDITCPVVVTGTWPDVATYEVEGGTGTAEDCAADVRTV